MHITGISASQTHSWNASGSSISGRPDPNCIFHRSLTPSVSDIKAREKSGQQPSGLLSCLPSVLLSSKGTRAHMSSPRYAPPPRWKAHSRPPNSSFVISSPIKETHWFVAKEFNCFISKAAVAEKQNPHENPRELEKGISLLERSGWQCRGPLGTPTSTSLQVPW